LLEVDARLSELNHDNTSWAQLIVGQRQILPILDGLDELPVAAQATVVRSLNAALDRVEGIVLTSRTEQYRNAIQMGDVLTGAAVIELQPLALEVVEAHLARTSRPSGRNGQEAKWAPVFSHLRNHPQEPISESLCGVLTNPLMLWLARTQYSDTDADPMELVAADFEDPTALRHHLIGGLIAAVYADPGHHYEQRFEVARAERWLARLAAIATSRSDRSLSWWNFADRMSIRIVRIAVTATASVLAASAATIITLLRNDTTPSLFVGVAFGAVVAIAIWLVPWLRNRPTPSAIASISPAQALRQIGQVSVVGLITVAMVIVPFFELRWQAVPSSISMTVSTLALVCTVVVGILSAPAEIEHAADPQGLLLADRASAVTQGSLIGFAAGLLSGTGAWASVPNLLAIAIGIVFGVVSGLTWAVLGSAWGRFGLVRFYWWSTGQLPLRLMNFLVDAHRRGVLRRAGAVYRFRHDTLLDHISTRTR
jgi:hypothetical protein